VPEELVVRFPRLRRYCPPKYPKMCQLHRRKNGLYHNAFWVEEKILCLHGPPSPGLCVVLDLDLPWKFVKGAMVQISKPSGQFAPEGVHKLVNFTLVQIRLHHNVFRVEEKNFCLGDPLGPYPSFRDRACGQPSLITSFLVKEMGVEILRSYWPPNEFNLASRFRDGENSTLP